ncbi:MAG: site-specific integrase [Tateyamaria sp.]|uniref:tyrosine-type recombinase/integrase n=1 Tax=Tateyamaria sp. TaxID=1929288 RepID=UPI003281EF2B
MFQSLVGEPVKQAKVLSSVELKRVVAICVTMQNGKRNRLMLMLSHYAGMRVGEIASLKWTDVLDKDLKPKAMFYLKAENTKAKEARQVHLNAKLQKELATYWAQLNRWKKPERPVIQSQKGAHFSPNSVVQAFKRVLVAAGIEDASSHIGRRWFITQMAHAGVSPKVIMELAGHKQLTTTQRYIDVTDEQKRSAVDLL